MSGLKPRFLHVQLHFHQKIDQMSAAIWRVYSKQTYIPAPGASMPRLGVATRPPRACAVWRMPPAQGVQARQAFAASLTRSPCRHIIFQIESA